MVSKKEIIKQLKKIDFNHKGWGRAEVSELHNIILPDEEIYECVNGIYDGGFALLVATDIRILLIDKKPLNYLTVEDMRFDTINEMDYSHRLFGAEIGISAGSKNLRFRSYNQPKLRELIGHVQHCMAESKKQQSNHQDTQVSHLEQINKQLQEYLTAQASYQLQLNNQQQAKDNADALAPPKPSYELADYLYAQSLLAKHLDDNKKLLPETTETDNMVEKEPKSELANDEAKVASENETLSRKIINVDAHAGSQGPINDDIYEDGMREVFGSQFVSTQPVAIKETPQDTDKYIEANELKKIESGQRQKISIAGFDINPLHIAYSKLPTALRNRKFGKPSIAPYIVVHNDTTKTTAAGRA